MKTTYCACVRIVEKKIPDIVTISLDLLRIEKSKKILNISPLGGAL